MSDLRKIERQLWSLFVLAVVSVISACSAADENDVTNWMAEQRNTIKPSVTGVAEPKKFDPAPYDLNEKIDPFNVSKLGGAFKPDVAVPDAGTALLLPELNRRKEPLEVFPLDSMMMVGTLQKGTRKIALIKVNQLLYQVDVKSYLGQNYGKVISIADNGITLREIVQDAAGEWIERSATLELQESKK